MTIRRVPASLESTALEGAVFHDRRRCLCFSGCWSRVRSLGAGERSGEVTTHWFSDYHTFCVSCELVVHMQRLSTVARLYEADVASQCAHALGCEGLSGSSAGLFGVVVKSL